MCHVLSSTTVTKVYIVCFFSLLLTSLFLLLHTHVLFYHFLLECMYLCRSLLTHLNLVLIYIIIRCTYTFQANTVHQDDCLTSNLQKAISGTYSGHFREMLPPPPLQQLEYMWIIFTFYVKIAYLFSIASLQWVCLFVCFYLALATGQPA